MTTQTLNKQCARKLIIYATCQGQFLARILNCSKPLTEQFNILSYLNFAGPRKFEPNPFNLTELKDCDVFIYHKPRAPEHLAITNKILNMLEKGTNIITIPYITSNLYWPLYETNSSPIGADKTNIWGIFPYRNPALEFLCDKEWPVEEVAEAYALIKPEQITDLEALRNSTYNYWQSLDNEAEGGVLVADFLRKNWQKELLFYIYNHPSKSVFLHMANQILTKLHLPLLTIKDIRGVQCGQEITYPIHLNVAEYYKLTFVKESTPARFNHKLHTCTSFIKRYVEEYRKEKVQAADLALGNKQALNSKTVRIFE